MLNVTADVFPLALAYLRIYLIGMPVILLYNFETAIFRSIGDTQAPLAVLAISGVLNVDHGTDFRRIVPLGCFGRRDGHSHRERRQLHDSAVSTGSY